MMITRHWFPIELGETSAQKRQKRLYADSLKNEPVLVKPFWADNIEAALTDLRIDTAVAGRRRDPWSIGVSRSFGVTA